MGFVILMVMGAYLLISIAVVAWVVTYAQKHNRRGWLWGLMAAFVMYNLVFWDWIPTIVVHKYYCEKEAGFRVYKTLGQWKKENPGVMEGLTLQLSIQRMPYGDLQIVDERFAIETRRHQVVSLLTTNIADRRLVDRKTGGILVKAIEIGSGVGNIATGGGFKFWLNQPPCRQNDFWKIVGQLEHIREQK